MKRFFDEDIRRNDLPYDAFDLIHDLCYHYDGRDVWQYVRRAQAILRHDNRAEPLKIAGREFLGKDVRTCRDHMTNQGNGCLSCTSAMNWNLFRAYCHCGEKAIAYRTTGPDKAVEFFCNEHAHEMFGENSGQENQRMVN